VRRVVSRAGMKGKIRGKCLSERAKLEEGLENFELRGSQACGVD